MKRIGRSLGVVFVCGLLLAAASYAQGGYSGQSQGMTSQDMTSQNPTLDQPVARESREMRKACKSDVKKFCQNVQPGGGRILSCLEEHQSEISAKCQQEVSGSKASRGAASVPESNQPSTTQPQGQ